MKGKSFEDLYNEFYRDLVRVAYGVTGSEEIAEEMAQEAFIRLYNREIEFSKEAEARYWLIRVVKNLCFNHLKRKKREREYLKKAERKKVYYEVTGETETVKDETKNTVRASLDSLPDKLRQPLELKEYGGLSYRDIAKTLKISESNVKVRIFRARKMLAEIIDKEDLYVSR